MLQILNRLPRMVQQANQLAIEKMLAYEHDDAHHQSSSQGQPQAEPAYAHRDRGIRQSPCGEKWQGENRDHSQPRYPYAVGGGGCFGCRVRFVAASPEPNQSDPGHRGDERNIVEAAAVIRVPGKGPVGYIGAGGIGKTGAEKVAVEGSPPAFAPEPGAAQRNEKSQLLKQVNCIQVPAIGQFIGDHVLPRDHNQDVKINPPQGQQDEIKPSQPSRIFILGHMRAKGQSCHPWNNMQEQDDISRENVRHILTQHHLEVSPQ